MALKLVTLVAVLVGHAIAWKWPWESADADATTTETPPTLPPSPAPTYVAHSDNGDRYDNGDKEDDKKELDRTPVEHGDKTLPARHHSVATPAPVEHEEAIAALQARVDALRLEEPAEIADTIEHSVYERYHQQWSEARDACSKNVTALKKLEEAAKEKQPNVVHRVLEQSMAVDDAIAALKTVDEELLEELGEQTAGRVKAEAQVAAGKLVDDAEREASGKLEQQRVHDLSQALHDLLVFRLASAVRVVQARVQQHTDMLSELRDAFHLDLIATQLRLAKLLRNDRLSTTALQRAEEFEAHTKDHAKKAEEQLSSFIDKIHLITEHKSSAQSSARNISFDVQQSFYARRTAAEYAYLKSQEELSTAQNRTDAEQNVRWADAALAALESEETRTMHERAREEQAAMRAQAQEWKNIAARKAKTWYAAGKLTIKAQKLAHEKERVYEGHEGRLEQQTQNLRQRGEAKAERLVDSIQNHFDVVNDALDDRISEVRNMWRKRHQELAQEEKIFLNLGTFVEARAPNPQSSSTRLSTEAFPRHLGQGAVILASSMTALALGIVSMMIVSRRQRPQQLKVPLLQVV